jgi:hypothetical protein
MLAAMKITIVVAVIAAACSKSAPPPGPPGEGIELVDPGALPHRELRYHLAKGATTLLELAMDLDIAMGPRGGAMPTVVLQMEIRADEVRPDGSARIRTRIANARAKDRPNTALPTDIMSAQAAMLAGLELTATLAPRGTLSESKVASASKDLPPALASQLAQLNQSLEQVAMPLPAEPVGVGAKWRNRKTVVQNGVKMETVTTIEVVSIDGDKIAFKSASSVSGDDQKVDVEGNQVAISKVGGSGNNHGVIDLGKMVMTGEFGADFHFDMAAKDQTIAMTMRVATRLQPIQAFEAATEPTAPSAKPTAAAPAEPLEQHEPAKTTPVKEAAKPAEGPS